MSVFNYKISTHVLDTHKGRPVVDLHVKLYKLKNGNEWINISEGKTRANGRCADFSSSSEKSEAGTYKLHFETGSYFSSMGEKAMCPFIDIVFHVENPEEHYHIPLLLNAHGYTTYRGS